MSARHERPGGGKREGRDARAPGQPRKAQGERRKPSHREGRKRYVALVLQGRRPPRAELDAIIGRACAGKCRFKLTYYEGGNAVVRFIEEERPCVMEALKGLAGIDPTVSALTLVTSGSIRKAKEAFPSHEPRPT